MNIREMKLALTVDLMNLPDEIAPVATIQHSMSRFVSETGHFKGCKELETSILEGGIERKTIALQFENVTLDLDLITNEHSSEQLVKGFDLKENFA
ncbi:MAG: hypothetical protein GC192_18385 [Bacteroidetes bacterium]|nr:hypothetical protein [Bacteroidota bacterium]